MNAAQCKSLGGYAEWRCVRDAEHDDDHRDALDRTWENTVEESIPPPVIEPDRITVEHAERALDRGDDGEMDIDGITVAYTVDYFDKEFVWFHNPGVDPGDEGEHAIARFEVERTLVRA